MHIYREISSLVAFSRQTFQYSGYLFLYIYVKGIGPYMKKVKNLQIRKSSKRKNHRFIELKEKTCKVSETHRGFYLAKQQPFHPRARMEVSCPCGITVSFIHDNKNTFASSTFWSFSKQSKSYSPLFTCHPTPRPRRQSG